MIKILTRIFFVSLVWTTGQAWAACSGPAGQAGQQIFDTSRNIMAFCDGTNWVSMSGGTNVSVGGTVNNPAGNDYELQFKSGTGFGSSSGLTWNNATSTLTATNIAGTLSTAAQPNITSIGTLTGLTVNGTVSATTANFTTLTVNGVAITGSASGDRITSGTLSATANNATGIISLTTGGTTWGYMGSSANYLPNLRTNTISATAGIQVGNVATTCASGISGTIRYNSASNTMEYCTGTAWANLGPSATTPVSFLVTRGSNQTVPNGSYTKVQFDTKSFDTNNNYDATTNYRFTPTVPGKYLFASNVYCADATTQCNIVLYKNGSGVAASYQHVNGGAPGLTAVIDMNGTTDYVEIYVYNGGGTAVSGGYYTYFSGALLAPQGGGAGGTATPAGSSADVQYNSGGSLAADTGLFTYSAGVLKAPTVSTTNVSATTATLTSVGAGNITASGAVTANTVSTSTLTVTGNGSEGCATVADYGKMRFNPTTRRMQLCKP